MKKYLFLLIFLLLCAFFGFSQGDYKIKSLAFPATGSTKVIKISTSLAGADTANNTNFPTGKAVNDRIRALAGGSGGGNTNSNVGSAFRFAIPNTNNIKTLSTTYGLTIDTITTNQVNAKLDSSTVYNKVRAIVSDSVSKPLIMDNIGTGLPIVWTNNADSAHFKTILGANGLTGSTNPDSTNKIVLGGDLVQNTTIGGTAYTLNAGGAGDKLLALRGNVSNSFGFTSDGGAGSFVDQGPSTLTLGNTSGIIPIKGGLELSTIFTATDANTSTLINYTGIILPDITANRVFQISGSVGKIFIIMHRNSTGFTWSPTGMTIKDGAGNTIPNLVNGKTYLLYYDGTNYISLLSN